MEIDPSIFIALQKATKRSTHKRHMTGCVIARKNKIVSNGCSHASSFRLAQLNSIHAEIHALGRGRHTDLTGSVAYIMTVARKSHNITFSAPCLTCAIALKSAGINNAIYTDESGGFQEINLEDDLSHLKVYKKRT